MASRWMQAKLAIMARQRKVTPSDTINRGGHSLAASAARSAELAKACEGYTGVVTVAEKGPMLPSIGKNRRRYDRTVGARGGSARALDLHEWSETATWALVRR